MWKEEKTGGRETEQEDGKWRMKEERREMQKRVKRWGKRREETGSEWNEGERGRR